MLPNKSENIYPKTVENIQAVIDYYFSNYVINDDGAVDFLRQHKMLSLNQVDFILKMLSVTYEPIFKDDLKGVIQLKNLLKYAVDALLFTELPIKGSQTRINLTKEFRKFVQNTQN